MLHKVKLTVIDKKLYPELQAQYCADPDSGVCPCYNVGDEFIFERYGTADDFWHMGLNTLKQTVNTADGVAGGTEFPHCSEAWDAISRYIYTGLQGGSIMRGWMNDERVMIACCSDGTRPVIFKIERLDYKQYTWKISLTRICGPLCNLLSKKQKAWSTSLSGKNMPKYT